MNYSQTEQNTQLADKSPICDLHVENGVLYFTIDFGESKQRWKNDGINSVFVAYVR